MAAEYLLINQSGDRQTVETIGERLPQFDIVPPLALIVESVDPVDGCALVVPAEHVDAPGDPTGCGDVFGATYFSRLLTGDTFAVALRAAIRAASRNVTFRGAGGLAAFLRGELLRT